ncbi:M16 family metallopeptidase [Truepera radiovictrix]|uniref:Peptidase M16 domain protein n=1 Tax=Truepera radiovictrix (strain DSM 17093 / CIP 108686 / LMG 22925 / RQ-24) TaxID=649638 RepID=D7CVA4_TRURR|nr:pitrilysin family protein [Truepera radiovictrix]ADI14132.1 peptidase M16 domain protein [Truepera radiovictrix DSM 17093]WMT57307.1 pitrilysin family protein [Truepera radiovictrix]
MDPEPVIHTHTFENGLTLVLEPMPWLPSAAFELLLPFGAATDPTGAAGSATVLHDWLYRGAGGRDSRAFSDALDALGVRRGGGAGRESSSFSGSLLADALPEALGLYADLVRRPHLESGEFEGARALALQELASLDDSPTERLFIALTEALFASPHARSPYGEEAELRALTPEGVRADARRRLAPRGAVLSVAGGVAWEPLKETVAALFGDWQGDGVALPEVALKAPRRAHVAAPTAQTQIGVAFAALPPGDPHWYHNALAVGVLSGGMGSRLFSEVREKRALVYSVAAVSRTVRGFGYTLGYAGTTPERADETLRVLLRELERLREGVTEDELERARTGLLSSLVMQGESSGARASALARDLFLLGAPRTVAEVQAGVEAVTLESLNRFLANQRAPRFTVVTLGPKPLAAPSTPDALEGART